MSRYKNHIQKFTIIVFFIFAGSICFADSNESIGKVVAIRGKISAQGSDLVQRELSINSPVFLHDTIKTEQGRIQLMFNDNTLITLGSNSEIKLTKYAWKPNDKNSAMETQIQEGSFRIMGGAVTRTAPQNFKTHTPSGTIGIRGSMYAGIIKGNTLSVMFQGGKGIYVKNDIGIVNITKPGFGTHITSASQAPEEPKKLTQEELTMFETALASNTDNNQSGPSGQKIQQSSESQSNQTTTAQTGQQDSTTAETSAETAVLISDPDLEGSSLTTAPVTNEISKVTETTLASTQAILSTTLIPAGPDQKIRDILLNLGYTGSFEYSSVAPSTGIWVYTGKMENALLTESPDNMKFIVNWDNGRIIGLEDISKTVTYINTGFGFGNVDSSGTISGIRVLGSDNANGSGIIRAMTGSETFGHFYGADQSGLGLLMEGYDINLQDQTDQIQWKDISGAVISAKTVNSYSGTETWSGFFTGIAEDMASPFTNRRAFRNINANEYTFTINKDNGRLIGSLTGYDFLNVGNSISGVTIGGGTSDSVYITDTIMGASLSSGPSAINIGGNLGGLKTYGNFMIASETSPLSTYTTWGCWEAAYFEPGTGKNYHIHVPGSVWIAGNPTPAASITGLIGANFTGTYTGKAEGVVFDSSSPMTRMTNGTTNLLIDFKPAAPLPISGNIAFDQITLPLGAGTAITTSGYQASVLGAVSSSVNGNFFGPAAEATGGNFSATMPDGKQYHGIFAGNR